MKLIYTKYIIEAENQLDIKNFNVIMSVYFKLEGDVNNIFGEKMEQLVIIQNNNQTGFEMDEEREFKATEFVKSLSI